jgi:glycosyltransferase involved in cell wall biosynthesis
MKILHVFNELKFSGAEIMYVDSATFFQSKGHQLFAIATGENIGEYSIYFKNANYEVFHNQMPPLKNYFKRIKYSYCIYLFLKSHKFDVVHIHSSNSKWVFALCAWLNNVKSVYTFHNVFSTNWYSYFYHILIRLSCKYIFKCRFHTISDSVFKNESKLFHNKTNLIYNWYNDIRFYPSNNLEIIQIKKKLNLTINSFIIISIGGCSEIKRHTDIIKAFEIVQKKIPNCIYLHLGTGCAEANEIELANKLNISDKIIFCGNKSNVRDYLIVSDLYLMTSKFEGISITTIEAMACRIPTILYNVPGLKDFNNYGLNSIIINEDYQELAQKIIYYNNNYSITEKYSTNAFNMVKNTFSMNKNAELINNLYIH